VETEALHVDPQHHLQNPFVLKYRRGNDRGSEKGEVIHETPELPRGNGPQMALIWRIRTLIKT
jgi:hypothetical protein